MGHGMVHEHAYIRVVWGGRRGVFYLFIICILDWLGAWDEIKASKQAGVFQGIFYGRGGGLRGMGKRLALFTHTPHTLRNGEGGEVVV